jgi:hypothetical protein
VRKRLLVATIIGTLSLMFVPAMPAGATGEGATAVVAVFTGNASVNPGLCIPGDAPGCVGPTDPANYNLTIPGDPAPAPAVCAAAGVFEGGAVAGTCDLIANGNVTGSAAGLKASCGLSHGVSAGVNSITLNDVVSASSTTRNTSNSWITSAGGTIPVTGAVDDGDDDGDPAGDHTLVALVQARPIGDAGQIPCVTQPASTFIIAGVGIVA